MPKKPGAHSDLSDWCDYIDAVEKQRDALAAALTIIRDFSPDSRETSIAGTVLAKVMR